MPFDFAYDDAVDAALNTRQRRGLVNYHNGRSAEDAVAAHYEQGGMPVLAHRWRGQGGEIDLICQGDDGLIFVEVKKSRSHDAAAAHLSFAQLSRIAHAAEEYIGKHADPMTPMRLDLATVDGTGRIDTLENLTLY